MIVQPELQKQREASAITIQLFRLDLAEESLTQRVKNGGPRPIQEDSDYQHCRI